MDKLFGVLEVVLPVIMLVAIGIFIRKRKIVTEQGMSEIKALLMNICLPALLFNTFYAIRFTWREGIVLLTLALVTLLAFIAGRFICPLLGIRQRIAPYLCTTVEGGSIGYALFILLFGQEHLYHIALLPPTYAYSVYAKGESEQSYVGAVLGLYTILTIIGFTVFAWILA